MAFAKGDVVLRSCDGARLEADLGFFYRIFPDSREVIGRTADKQG